jgi:hypothetical protein
MITMRDAEENIELVELDCEPLEEIVAPGIIWGD